MRKVFAVVVLVVSLAGCSSFSEGVKDGASGDQNTRLENAARAKDTSGVLDGYDQARLVTLGKGVCLRLSTPKPGNSANETVAQVKADGPADVQGTAWNEVVDAADQELCPSS